MVEGAALEMLCTEMYLGFESLTLRQISCLICLPDKSGNFLAFRAKTAQNTVKPEKTGFGLVNQTAPGRFLRFRTKNPAHLLGQHYGAVLQEKVSGGWI